MNPHSSLLGRSKVFLLLALALLVSGFAFTGFAAGGKSSNAPTKFKVEIDGIISGGFKEISGLESEIEVIEFQNGDDPLTRKRPGKVKYGNITLEREFVNDSSLLEWYKNILAGKTERKSGSIIYLDRAGQEVLRYNFFEAWPCRWSLPELTSDGKSVAIEKIEICVEKIERA